MSHFLRLVYSCNFHVSKLMWKKEIQKSYFKVESCLKLVENYINMGTLDVKRDFFEGSIREKVNKD